MRLTLMTTGLILAIAGTAPAQEATGGLGASGGSGLGFGNASGMGLQSSGGLAAGSKGGIGIGGAGIGANGGLGTGLNLRTPHAAGGLDLRTGVGATGNVPGLDVSGSVNGAGRLRARDRRTMRPEERSSSQANVSVQEGLHAESQSLLQADLFLANRLSQIDRLRDHAVANNDFEMLSRADVLEKQARLQHAKRIRSGNAASLPTETDATSSSKAHLSGQAAFQGQQTATNAQNWSQSAAQFGLSSANRASAQAHGVAGGTAADARFHGAAALEASGEAIQPAGYQARSMFSGGAEAGTDAAAALRNRISTRTQSAGQYDTSGGVRVPPGPEGNAQGSVNGQSQLRSQSKVTRGGLPPVQGETSAAAATKAAASAANSDPSPTADGSGADATTGSDTAPDSQ